MKTKKKVELKSFEGKRKLKRGEIATIAKRAWFSESHVSNVLSGRRRDSDGTIFQAAKSIVKGRR